MNFKLFFAILAAFSTTVGLYGGRYLLGPPFGHRSMRTEGRVVEMVFSGLPLIVEDAHVKILFEVNGKKRVKRMPRRDIRITRERAARIGDQVTFCYSPYDVENIVVETGNNLTCAPPDEIKTAVDYTLHTLILEATVCTAFLAFYFPAVSTFILLLGTPIYLVTLGK